MKYKDLYYSSLQKRFNKLIISIKDVKNNYINVERFFVNSKEFNDFQSKILDNNFDVTPFKYIFSEKRYEFDEFIDFFGIELVETNNYSEIIDYLNEWFVDRTISIVHSAEKNFNQINDLIYEDENRRAVYSYFRNREYIKIKDSIHFPFSLGDISNEDKCLLRMFNVGQANISCLYVNNKPKIIFDLGKSRRCNDAIHLLSTDLTATNDLKTIIISHYDNDHINMAECLPCKANNLQFIMPEFLHPTDINKPNILILMSKIVSNGGKVCFVLNDSLSNPVNLNYLFLLQGRSQKNDCYQSTNENSHGLICGLNIHNTRVLIPGDVLYNDLYTNIVNPLNPDYLIVPHHCCRYNSQINSNIIDVNEVKETFTFCGPNGRYRHPNSTHITQFPNSINHRLISQRDTVYENSITITNNFFIDYLYSSFCWIL